MRRTRKAPRPFSWAFARWRARPVWTRLFRKSGRAASRGWGRDPKTPRATMPARRGVSRVRWPRSPPRSRTRGCPAASSRPRVRSTIASPPTRTRRSRRRSRKSSRRSKARLAPSRILTGRSKRSRCEAAPAGRTRGVLSVRWACGRGSPNRFLPNEADGPFSATCSGSVADGEQALVDELLSALGVVDLGRVDIAPRVHGHVVDKVELAGIAAASAKTREHLAVVAQQEPDVVVLAVGGVKVGLSAVL